MISPACHCGWRRQDPKRVVIFCLNHAYYRRRFYETAGTDYTKRLIILIGKGLRAVARWVMNEGHLSQFSLAKEQSDWVEGKDKEEEDEIDNNSNNDGEHEHEQEETSEREE